MGFGLLVLIKIAVWLQKKYKKRLYRKKSSDALGLFSNHNGEHDRQVQNNEQINIQNDFFYTTVH